MADEIIFASGKIFEIVQLPQPDGRVFEIARRAPGVRLIIAQNGKLLLTEEFRRELGANDYRLPGGKVFDTLAEYEAFRQSGQDILDIAAAKAQAEAAEEAGVQVGDVTFYKKSTLGTTVEWDLYVFVGTSAQELASGQSLETGEQIDNVHWFTFVEVEQLILAGKMQEERIALILLQWLKSRANDTTA